MIWRRQVDFWFRDDNRAALRRERSVWKRALIDRRWWSRGPHRHTAHARVRYPLRGFGVNLDLGSDYPDRPEVLGRPVTQRYP